MPPNRAWVRAASAAAVAGLLLALGVTFFGGGRGEPPGTQGPPPAAHVAPLESGSASGRGRVESSGGAASLK